MTFYTSPWQLATVCSVDNAYTVTDERQHNSFIQRQRFAAFHLDSLLIETLHGVPARVTLSTQSILPPPTRQTDNYKSSTTAA